MLNLYPFNFLRESDITFIQCIHTIFCRQSIFPFYNIFINLLREIDITIIQCNHTIFCRKAALSSYNTFIQSSAGRRNVFIVFYGKALLPLSNIFVHSSAGRRHLLHTRYSYSLLREGDMTFKQCIHIIFCGKVA